MTVLNQGLEANRSGIFLEDIIQNEFLIRGAPSFRFSKKRFNDDLFYRRFLLKNVPYRSIYDCKSTSEFVYRDLDGHDIRIECKNQDSKGSVDEKFPYLIENARRTMPEREIWLVVEGLGARPKAVAWLKKEAASIRHKTIRVMGIGEARKLIRNLHTNAKAASPASAPCELFSGAAA